MAVNRLAALRNEGVDLGRERPVQVRHRREYGERVSVYEYGPPLHRAEPRRRAKSRQHRTPNSGAENLRQEVAGLVPDGDVDVYGHATLDLRP